jgi:Zn-finger nucleic acid-binding protein
MGVLEEVIRSAAKRKVKTGEGSEGPVHGGVEPVRYARCPVCGGGMARLPFAQKPLVIIDQCPSHGEWCDGGELAQLKTVARSRGVDEALGRSLRPAPPKAETSKSAAAVKAGLEGDALIAEMRKRGGSWRLLPSSMEDAPRNIFTSRRRGRHDLFDVIWYLLDL